MRTVVLALVVLGLGACAAQPQQPAIPVRVGLVGWPLDPADALHALTSELETCLAEHIRATAPEVAVVTQREVRDALFPLLEPATQPETEAAFAAMLARDDVRARLQAHDLGYLVAYAGGTRKEEWSGAILCGAGYGGGGCLGFAWRGETTRIDAALWTLDGKPLVRVEPSEARATSIMPAFGLPVPIIANSSREACHALGTRIAAAIRQAAAR